MEKIDALLQKLIENNTLIRIIFSGVRKKTSQINKVVVRPVLLQGDIFYQAEYHQQKKVTHENLTSDEFLETSKNLIEKSFKQVNIFSVDGDYHILASKPDKPRILKKPPTMVLESLEHNQSKNYIIPEGKPCDFLIRLGVMNKDGQVLSKHYAKFRQINRFLEIVSDVLPYLNNKKVGINGAPLRIIDFGCGKAYLTFALYYYLKLKLGKNVEIIGLDLKEDVIEFCNQVAKDLQYNELKFLLGDIADYTGSDRADMVVTLHACDTATDFALMKAVHWGASVILSVPCCQHELFSQIHNPLHQPILKHGLLKERFSALLTDGLRGLKLEEAGYEVSMIEFTNLEHTAKNIMIRGVKTGKKNIAAGEEYRQLLEYWNVNPLTEG
ncbi:MAG: class I SAM-dependent methyltransferase [Anaerovoracaceae bacterium]|jgi:SAM-dependent methyltransferase